MQRSLKHPFSLGRPVIKAPIPAFMQIEGPIVGPLPPEAQGHANPGKFWLVQPWVIVSLVIGITLALMIPGLILDFTRGF